MGEMWYCERWDLKTDTIFSFSLVALIRMKLIFFLIRHSSVIISIIHIFTGFGLSHAGGQALNLKRKKGELYFEKAACLDFDHVSIFCLLVRLASSDRRPALCSRIVRLPANPLHSYRPALIEFLPLLDCSQGVIR